MSQQPYAPPADDGGGQGSFTRPDEALAMPNAADPNDRSAAGSFATGVKENRPTTEDVRSRGWLASQHVWKALSIIVLMITLFSGVALVGSGYFSAAH